MTAKRKLGEALLAANGIAGEGISEEDRQAIEAILKRDKARVRRLKWILVATLCWLLIVYVGLGVGGSAKIDFSKWPVVEAIIIISMTALPLLLIVGGISLLIRSFLLRSREFKAQLLVIQARLSGTRQMTEQLSAIENRLARVETQLGDQGKSES